MKKINEFVLRNIADEYVAIPVGETTEQFNGIITLSETGAFIYQHIEEAETFEDLIRIVRSEYEVDQETAEQDAVYFINQMLYTGMIALSDPEKNW